MDESSRALRIFTYRATPKTSAAAPSPWAARSSRGAARRGGRPYPARGAGRVGAGLAPGLPRAPARGAPAVARARPRPGLLGMPRAELQLGTYEVWARAGAGPFGAGPQCTPTTAISDDGQFLELGLGHDAVHPAPRLVVLLEHQVQLADVALRHARGLALARYGPAMQFTTKAWASAPSTSPMSTFPFGAPAGSTPPPTGPSPGERSNITPASR